MSERQTAGHPRTAAVLLSWLLIGQWRAQPGRLATATLAIAIGVSLSLSIELVNRSALSEFGKALAVVNGEAQASLISRSNGMAESLFDAVLAEPMIAAASPVVEGSLQYQGKTLRVLGLDVMRAAMVTPGLLPQGDAQGSATALFDEDALFLSPAALQAWQLQVGQSIEVRVGMNALRLRIAGTVPGAARGQIVGVMDIGAAQWRLGWLGRLSRIDLRLRDGVDLAQLSAAWAPRLPGDAQWSTPDASGQRMSNLSRAYRVNLSVLALVALFTGGFIVHATQTLASARMAPTLAMLNLLGARPRLSLICVLVQGATLGSIGAGLGVLGGLAMAEVLLRLVGGDLGGGYFATARTTLDAHPGTLLLFAGLGLSTALAGSLGPALAMRRQTAVQALRASVDFESARWQGPVRIAGVLAAAGLLLSFAPAWQGLPLAAYAAIALWLFAGIVLVGPLTVLAGRLSERLMPGAWRSPSLWLALQRIGGAPRGAAVALSGVVASFALASAMTIMVDSFRHSVAQWLDRVLPAELYGRTGNLGAQASLGPEQQARIRQVEGVASAEFLRSLDISLKPERPAVSLLARTIDRDSPGRTLPLVGQALSPSTDQRPLWASEAMADLYGLKPGSLIDLPVGGRLQTFQVAGIWRDYARQHGAVVIDRADYLAITGDASANDIALTLVPGTRDGDVLERLRSAVPMLAEVDFRSAREIRELSLNIFDRSFAVTYALEAIAIVVGLFGVAATYAGQALARAREFGVLRHLGFTRTQVMRVFAMESAALITIGVAWGAFIGALIALLLVHRVNPQSFHWTMDLHWPIELLLLSASALIGLGVLSALLAARSAAGEAPVRAVREDW